MPNKQMLILVNEHDEEIGYQDKEKVHQLGILHRAFSIFVFNTKGEILLQRRALHKYHSPGLWSNTCCSHPGPSENVKNAARRRLMQEMGIQCELEAVYSFIYKAEFENGLIEHEYDHVFIGFSDDEPKLNPLEVIEWRYMSVDQLRREMKIYPTEYTVWLNICFEEAIKAMNK